MGHRPVFIMHSGERATNAQVFATKKEAHDSATDRFRVWTTPVGVDTEMCDAPVNYIRVDGRDERKTE